MKLFKILKEAKQKISAADEKAQNPFISREKHYNPFRGNFASTYVWIEKKEYDKRKHPKRNIIKQAKRHVDRKDYER